MAGLNEGVELDHEIIDPIRQINVISIAPDSVVTNVASSPTTNDAPTTLSPKATVSYFKQDRYGIDTVPDGSAFDSGGVVGSGNRIDLKSSISLIENGVNVVTDVIDFKKTLIKAGAVCQEDIKTFDSLLPGFINETELLGYYTKSPSKTRFKHALESIEKSVTDLKNQQLQNAIEIATELNIGIDQSIAYFKDSIGNLEENYIPRKDEALEELNSNSEKRDISGYRTIVERVLNNGLDYNGAHRLKKVPELLESSFKLVKDNPHLCQVLSKISGNKQSVGKDTIQTILFGTFEFTTSPDSLTFIQLLNAVGSRQELLLIETLISLLEDKKKDLIQVLSSLKSELDSDFNDDTNLPENMKSIKIIDETITKTHKLVFCLNSSDSNILRITDELVRVISSLP
jgi:hypothetical protein